MKIARALEAYSGPVFEGNSAQKELPSSFKKIAAGSSTIHLAGSKKKSEPNAADFIFFFIFLLLLILYLFRINR